MKKLIVLSLIFCLGVSYTMAQGNWYPKDDFGGAARYAGIGFAIGTKGYVGTGVWFADFWEYESTTDVWTQKADYPLTVGGGMSFVIGNKGYAGVGTDGTNYNASFYEYDPAGNTWTAKNDYNAAVILGVGFSIGNKGYFGTGSDGTNSLKDFWEYDPSNDTWTQKADVGSNLRNRATGFSIGNKGYICLGIDAANYDDLMEYDPSANTWTQKADFGGAARNSASAFVLNNKAYIVGGIDATFAYVDVWEYDPSNDKWTAVMYFKGGPRELSHTFAIGNLGYVVAGRVIAADVNFVWEYNPLAPGFYQYPNDTMACAGGSITLSVQGYGDGVEYKWQKDSVDITGFTTDSFYTIASTTGADLGYYRCIIRNAHGYDTSGNGYLNLTTGPPSITLQPLEQLDCKNFDANLIIEVQSNSQVYYQWFKDGKEVAGAIDSVYNITGVQAADTGYYYCFATNVCGVQLSDSVMVHFYKPPAQPTITQSWSQLTCVEDYAGYQWLKYNTPINGATYKTHIIKDKAKYSVQITDGFGCTRKSIETLFTPSSIDENTKQRIVNVYPNPNRGVFTLKLNTNVEVDIKVVNALGEIVFEELKVDASNYTKQIDLSNAESGIYFVQVQGENINYSDRIFIQK